MCVLIYFELQITSEDNIALQANGYKCSLLPPVISNQLPFTEEECLFVSLIESCLELLVERRSWWNGGRARTEDLLEYSGDLLATILSVQSVQVQAAENGIHRRYCKHALWHWNPVTVGLTLID